MVLSNSSFIYLNSKDSISGPSSTDFQIILPEYNYQRGLVSVSVEGVHFFNAQYPIYNGNNVITYYENAGSLETQTLTPGSYTATELTALLKTTLELGASGNTYNITYNNNTKKLTLEVTSGTSIQFDWTQTSFPAESVIGFGNVTITNPIAQVAANPVNLSGELYVDLELTGWSNNNIMSGRTSNSILHRLPLDVTYGTYVNFQATMENDFVYLSDEQLMTVQIRLLNPNGTVYDLPSTMDVSVVLRVASVK